jgi:hypothetical protein
MSFVAASIAIGGSAAIGAGASIYSGMQQSSAAKKAADRMITSQGDAYDRSIKTSQAGQAQALAYLDPFRQYGLNAGASLQAALYSPEQQQQQQQQQRFQLEGEIARLESTMPTLEGTTVTPGKKYQTRKQTAYLQESSAIQKQIAQAKSKLEMFDKQAAASPISASGPQIEASPWYQFQADLLNRSQDRAFAARGLTGSGFEAEERRRGLIELGAGETERQFARLKGLYDVGANAASVGAGTITNTSQNIANNQVAQGQAIGQAQAQGIIGVAGANSNIATGIANAATGAVGAGLNYSQFQSLINANQTGPAVGIRPTTGYGLSAPTVNSYGTGSNQYLINPPR